MGHLDGDTLVIDTVIFTEGILDGFSGTLHSDQLHIVKSFTRDKDGATLLRTHKGGDPRYLTEPFEGQHRVVTTTAPFDHYDCE